MALTADRPHDPALADALAARADLPALLAAAREQLHGVDPAARAAWKIAVPLEVLYHPGRYLRAAYALPPDEQTPPERVWPDGDLVYIHAPVRTPLSRRGTIVRIGGVAFEMYRFPNDRRLRGLRRFASSRLAPRVWQAWTDAMGRHEVLDPKTLQRRFVRYVPEYKWIIRLRAEFEPQDGGAPVKRRIAVRCASPTSCQTLARRQLAISQALTAAGAAARVPPLVGVDRDRGLVAIEWDRGEPLLDRLRAEGPEGLIGGLVSSLQAFHSVEIDDLNCLNGARLGEMLARSADELALACPEMSNPLAGLKRQVVATLAAAGEGATATLHNDLHPAQVHFKRDRFTFLDLERMASGDPRIDVANLAVQLLMLPQRSGLGVSSTEANRWAAQFLTRWSTLSRAPLAGPTFRAFTAAALVKLAHGSMRHLRSGWRDMVHACLAVADRQLSGAPREPVAP